MEGPGVDVLVGHLVSVGRIVLVLVYTPCVTLAVKVAVAVAGWGVFVTRARMRWLAKVAHSGWTLAEGRASSA